MFTTESKTCKAIGSPRVVINDTVSDWAPTTSGVLQDTILLTVLFIIYKNDAEVRQNNAISKFAVDKKIRTDHERMILKEELRKISEWFQRWEMLFNVSKCHILQVGTIHPPQKKYYDMNGTNFESAQCTLALQLRSVSNFPSISKMPKVKLGFINSNLSLKQLYHTKKIYHSMWAQSDPIWNTLCNADRLTMQII